MRYLGIVDYLGNELVFYKGLRDRAATTDLAIIMKPNGNLKLMALHDILPISSDLYHEKERYIFAGNHFGGFSLKGGGKTYGRGAKKGPRPYYKFDYDMHGNLYVRQIHVIRHSTDHQSTEFKKTYGPWLMLTPIWIRVIKEKQRQKRLALKEAR